jgi:hypothetical protein
MARRLLIDDPRQLDIKRKIGSTRVGSPPIRRVTLSTVDSHGRHRGLPLHWPARVLTDARRYEDYVRLVQGAAIRERVDIACIVTRDYVLDFVILHQSLVESWTFYPFRLHAFVVEDDVYERLSAANLESTEVRMLDGGPGEWAANSALKVTLVEQSGLDRCIVSDVDNVFVAETPELFMLLSDHDYVFIGAPSQIWLLQPSLWGFRTNERSIEFARRWRADAEKRELAEASTLPDALLEHSKDLKVRVLGRLSKPEANSHWCLSPYDVQTNLRPFDLTADELGFREAQMGRAKVIHVGGLRARGHHSLGERMEGMVDLYPESAELLPLYLKLANRAATDLGMETIARPNAYLRAKLLDAGILAHRNQLPQLLARRGLLGSGVEVGVQGGHFSEHLLRHWNGQRLISVDPWHAADPDEYVDVSNVSQEEHDRLYAETRERLEAFGERSIVWRTTSVEAAARLEPRSLDFVYIDARHDYRSVKEDLGHWYDKVRPGGVLAGHDYLDGTRPQGKYGVKSAVDEFFAERGLPVRATYLDRPWQSWLVEVPSSKEAHVRLLQKRIASEKQKLPHERDEQAIADWQRNAHELMGVRPSPQV